MWLQESGAIVRGYSLVPPTSPNLFEAANVAQGMESCIGDIRDLNHLQRELTSFQPEIVIHMAAQPLVRLSYRQPIETYAVNVMGTAHLLEAVRTCEGVRSVVVVTTDKCYENQEWIWAYREIDRLGGHDPYSSSKAAAELLTESYRSSFFAPDKYSAHGVAIATARAGNVIGGGDWASDRLIPDIMRSFQAGLAVPIRNPGAIRPWQHVLEPLSGYLKLAEDLYDKGTAYSGGWNFGPIDREALSVLQIVERLGQLWGKGARWEIDSQPHVHEAGQLRLDCSKAAEKLDWHPALSINEALDFTVSWYVAFRREEEMRSFSVRQIETYKALAESTKQK